MVVGSEGSFHKMKDDETLEDSPRFCFNWNVSRVNYQPSQ